MRLITVNKVEHIGIVVKELEVSTKKYTKLLGLHIDKIEEIR